MFAHSLLGVSEVLRPRWALFTAVLGAGRLVRLAPRGRWVHQARADSQEMSDPRDLLGQPGLPGLPVLKQPPMGTAWLSCCLALASSV